MFDYNKRHEACYSIFLIIDMFSCKNAALGTDQYRALCLPENRRKREKNGNSIVLKCNVVLVSHFMAICLAASRHTSSSRVLQMHCQLYHNRRTYSSVVLDFDEWITYYWEGSAFESRFQFQDQNRKVSRIKNFDSDRLSAFFKRLTKLRFSTQKISFWHVDFL